jgi:gallidermin/nisin family lantibiotic
MNALASRNDTVDDHLELDVRVVIHTNAENVKPEVTSLWLCTPGCATNATCGTCSCQYGCISDINNCGTAYSC